jgi:hypothetical protein
MKISVFLVGAALIPLSATAFAARPAVYPLRSQSAETQGADNAFCYWQAKQQTGVDMTRQSQRPVRTKTRRAAADAGAGASEPPLPAAHGKSDGVSQAAGGESSTGASASSTQSIAASGAQSSAVGGSTAHAAAPSSGAPGVASSAVGSSPPLPPPEPPMTVYWQAFGDCMRSRGYGVQ